MNAVRRAVPDDVGALAALEATQALSAGWGPEGFRAEFRQGTALMLLAQRDGRPVGFICARLLPPEAQVLNLVCAPDCARTGVASALIGELFTLARAGGCSVATLELRSSNAPALACYRKAGFSIVGARPKFYNGTEDAILMDARL